MYGIPESTIADYIKLTSEFFIAKKKHDSQDRMCKEIGIGQSKKDPRTNYYISPYHDIGEKGFVKKENIGLRLTIDEVNIGDQVYTILANSEKNKIVALIP